VITGSIKTQVDAIWNAFWTGGISNPLEVIEQMTYLLFIKRLDELHTGREKKAAMLKKPIESPIFGPDQQHLRWSKFRLLGDAPTLHRVVADEVFPFIKNLGGADDSTYAHHMKDARFTIDKPALLAKVVDMLDAIPMEDRDTKGDLYEYMLGKIASAGQNGQFRTPRHIIKLMVQMMAPRPSDTICDPACGTAGFLVAAAEYLHEHHQQDIYADKASAKRFNHDTFHGFDFDSTMLRVGSMNMLLHGVENPAIENRDSLSEDHAGVEGQFSLILANPPFSGSLDYDSCAKDLLSVVKTRKTELLFVALFERLLRPGGRVAAIVPAGVLESDSAAHQKIRRRLVEDSRLIAVIALPHWVFKPYASVATCILIFQKSAATEKVWFYRIDNDGYSDGATKQEIAGSDIPELVKLWRERDSDNYASVATKHRFVTREEIREANYDLCHRYYLSGYRYPEDVPLVRLGDLFEVVRGTTPAASAVADGAYPFATTAAELKRADSWQIEGEAIVIPTVSATGHGHASIKSVHYVRGKAALATICVAIVPKVVDVNVEYVYHYLLRFKEQVLVPLMRGSANVSLSPERLADLRVPMPAPSEQARLVGTLATLASEVAELEAALRTRRVELDSRKATFGGAELGMIV
jgi:type I restriction-modification system DNA methylase subunit